MEKTDIAIVAAMRKEVQPLLDKINAESCGFIAGKLFFRATVGGKTAVIVVSGIGKVSAALATQAVIDKFAPDTVINFGTVGGFGDSVSAKKYYAVEKCCQYDFDLSALDDVSVGYNQDYDAVFFPAETNAADFLEKRVLATSDRFTCKPQDVTTVNSLGCSLCDMEGAAIAQVCLSNKTPLYMIKGVTDVYGSKSNAQQFAENLKAVSDGFPDTVLRLISNL